jgi:hypothetical protein
MIMMRMMIIMILKKQKTNINTLKNNNIDIEMKETSYNIFYNY